MTPQQALHIVAQASGKALLSREDHAAVAQALNVLKEVIEPSTPPVPKPK